MEQTVDQLISRLNAALDLGLNDLVSQLSATALATDPDDVRPHLYLARAEINQGRLTKALEHTELYLQKNAEDLYALLMRAWILLELNQFEEGKKTADFMLQLDPEYEHAHYFLAYYYFHIQKNLHWTEIHLKKAQQQTPRRTNYLSLASELAQAKGNYDEAESLYKEALQIEPDNAELLYQLGIFYLDRKQHAEAQELIREAIQQNPENEDYRKYYLLTITDIDLALKTIQEELEASTSPEQKSAWYTIQGYIYKEQKMNSTEALKAFELALEHNSNNGSAQFYSGLILCNSNSSKNKKKGAQCLRRAYELIPTNMAYCTFGAYQLAKLGYVKEAEEMFQKAFSYSHDRWTVWTNYAFYLLDVKKDSKQSLVYFQKAYEIQPNLQLTRDNYKKVLILKSPLYAAAYTFSEKIKSKLTWKILHWIVFLALASKIIIDMNSAGHFLFLLSLPILFWITRNPHVLLAPFLPIIRKRISKKEGLDL